jgi:hypothetical protein
LTVVGVVGNVNHTGIDSEPDLATHEPHGKRPWSEMNDTVVRTSVDPSSLRWASNRICARQRKRSLLKKSRR